jgi:hypothetical protein
MRQTTLIILTFLIYGCSTRQDPKEVADKDTTIMQAESTANFDTVLRSQCEHKDLSNEFDIKVYFERHTDTEKIGDSCFINILVIDKSSKTILDSMKIYSDYLFEGVFKDCNNILSYTTKVNIDKEIADNYFGDIVICDLNFDSKDDIAIICNSGGNGGPSYNYYLQGLNKTFYIDKYLTDTMNYFPTKINSKNRTLITYVHAGVCWLGEHIYKLDRTNKWTEKSHKTIDICKDEK